VVSGSLGSEASSEGCVTRMSAMIWRAIDCRAGWPLEKQ
jgi:hypothetical protein